MSRPPEEDRDTVKTKGVFVRVSPLQQKRWRLAAKGQGIKLAQWIRHALDRAARM